MNGLVGVRARAHSSGLALIALLIALAVPAPAVGQAVYGSISGNVKDSSGGVLPGVTVTITSVERKTTDSVVTNDSGLFIKERLLPGAYEVKAELSGFKVAVVPRVDVSIDTQTPVDFTLEVGQVAEQITVTGGSTLLTTDRADVATRFDTKQITDLPVLDRNFTKFVLLTPGTQQLNWQHAASENPQGSTQTMVNGQHFSGTTYQLDGTENRDPILGIIVINPTLESIQETKITSQNYDAEFGQATAGVVSVQTKSGTNSFRGSAFEFHLSDRFQSRNPFTQFQPNPVTGEFLPETSRDQFGGSIGGPIVENKWFFFGDYQGTRFTQGGSRLLSVPTDAARAGDLRAYGVNIYDPATRQQFPNNVIPSNRLSPQAQNILALIPRANAPGRDNGTRDNFVASDSETFEENSINVRVDGRLSDSLNTFARYSLGDFFRDGPTAFGQGGGQEIVSLGGVSDVRNHSLALGVDRTFSDTMLADFRFGFFKYKVNVLPFDFGTRPAADAGIPGPQPRQHVQLRPAGGLHRRRRLQRTGRLRIRIGPRRQPVQLPARSGREAVPDRRQPDEVLRQPQLQVRHRRPPRVQPARAERCAPFGRADVQQRPDVARGRRRAWPRDVPHRRRDELPPVRQPEYGRARAAVAPLLLRAGHLAGERQADAELRAAARRHQPADDQRAGQCRASSISTRARSRSSGSAASA